MPRSSLHSLLVFYLLLYHLRSTTVTGTQAVTRFQRWIVGDDVSASAESQCSGSVCYWYSYMTRRDGTIISTTSMFTTNQIGEYIWQERGQEVNGARVEVLFIYKVTNGFVVCSNCFSVSICPKEDGSAQVHLNVHFITHDIIDLSSCILYKDEHDGVSSSIGIEDFVDTAPSNKYHVECRLNDDDRTLIKSSQLSECPAVDILSNSSATSIISSSLTGTYVSSTNVSTPIATPPTGNSTNQGSGGDEATNVSTPIATPPTGNSTNQGSGGDEGDHYTAFIALAGLAVSIAILLLVFLVLVVLYKVYRRKDDSKEAFTPSTSDQDSMRYPITVADADTEEHSFPTMDADQTMHSEPAGIFYPRSSTGNGHEHSHFPPMTGLSYHGDESDDEC